VTKNACGSKFGDKKMAVVPSIATLTLI
jgi:hypothetical protein